MFVRLKEFVVKKIQYAHGAGRQRMGVFWWYFALFFVAQQSGSLINFYTGMFIIPHLISQDELGAILPLMQVASFFAMPLALFQTPVSKYLNTFMARDEHDKAKALLVDAGVISCIGGVVMVLCTLVMAPFVLTRIRIHETGVILFVCGSVFINGIRPILTSSIQALKKFNNIFFSGVIVAPTRLLLMGLALAGSFGIVGFLAANFLLELLWAGIAIWGIASLLRSKIPVVSYREHWREMFAFSLPLVALGLSYALSGFVEPLVIRHKLPNIESAAYYYLTRFGDIASCVGGITGVLLFPLISERFEKGQATQRLFLQAYLANIILGGLLVVAFWLGGGWLLHLCKDWSAYSEYAGLIWQLALIQVLNVALGTFIAYETACRRFRYVWVVVGLFLLKSIFLYSITGWEFFRPYLPVTWWEAGHRIPACRLGFVVGTSLVVYVLLALAMVFQLLLRRMQGRKNPIA